MRFALLCMSCISGLVSQRARKRRFCRSGGMDCHDCRTPRAPAIGCVVIRPCRCLSPLYLRHIFGRRLPSSVFLSSYLYVMPLSISLSIFGPLSPNSYSLPGWRSPARQLLFTAHCSPCVGSTHLVSGRGSISRSRSFIAWRMAPPAPDSSSRLIACRGDPGPPLLRCLCNAGPRFRPDAGGCVNRTVSGRGRGSAWWFYSGAADDMVVALSRWFCMLWQAVWSEAMREPHRYLDVKASDEGTSSLPLRVRMRFCGGCLRDVRW